MTEHAAVVFVFFFLAEYGSILLMCILINVLFLGGYLMDFTYLSFVLDFIIQYIDFDLWLELNNLDQEEFVTLTYLISEGLVYGIILGIKSSIMVFVFIWVRASFPRIRFDQLMQFC